MQQMNFQAAPQLFLKFIFDFNAMYNFVKKSS